MAALEAHDDIGAAGEPVDDLALAFIAPLGADDGDVGQQATFRSRNRAALGNTGAEGNRRRWPHALKRSGQSEQDLPEVRDNKLYTFILLPIPEPQRSPALVPGMVDGTITRLRAAPAESMDCLAGVPLTGAAEQMFFFHAPLAHVVAYENWQRDERLRQTYQRQVRMARRAGLPLPPQPLGECG